MDNKKVLNQPEKLLDYLKSLIENFIKQLFLFFY